MTIHSATPEAALTMLGRTFPDVAALEPLQSDRCQLSVLIPAHNEQPADILKQLSWLTRQQMEPDALEVIYAINNAPPLQSDTWRAAYERNQALLALPIYQNRPQTAPAPAGSEQVCSDISRRLAVFAIDMSSPDAWVEGCNVGLVRQRLLGETALRYARRGYNGLIMFSDADTYIDDPTMLPRALDAFGDDPSLVAIPGAMTMEVDPDHPEGTAIAQNFERVQLAALWYTLLRGWERQSVSLNPLKFYGPSMFMRAYEAADTGGFDTTDRIATDVIFGEKLVRYAADYDRTIRHGRDISVGVINALRWSARTRNNTLHDGFALATTPGPMLVKHPLASGAAASELHELTPELLSELAGAVRQLDGGEAYVDHMLHRSFIARARVAD